MKKNLIPSEVLALAYAALDKLNSYCIDNGIDCTCAILIDGAVATFIPNTTGVYIPYEFRSLALADATIEDVDLWYENLYPRLVETVDEYKRNRVRALEAELNKLIGR